MSPQQKRPRMELMEAQESPIIDEATTRELSQSDTPDYAPRTNLFAIMDEAGPTWVEARIRRDIAQRSPVNRRELHQKAGVLAREMTVAIQREYDVSLPDNKLGQLYGMSRDFARTALGLPIPAPVGKIRKRGTVMHERRVIERMEGQA